MPLALPSVAACLQPRAPLRLARLVLVGLTIAVAGCRDEVELTGGLGERQANRVVVHLRHHGIASAGMTENRTRPDTYAVHVARSYEPLAREVLVRDDLFERRTDLLTAPFDAGALVPSPTADRARLMAGHGAALGRTLEQIDGVLRAHVHVMLPARDELSLRAPAPPPPTASVLLVCATPLATSMPAAPPIAEEQVKRLLAGAVEGLRPEAITVVYASRPAAAALVAPDMLASGGAGPERNAWIAFLGILGALAAAVAVLSLRSRGAHAR